jgi:nucleotide-binding universal stress UspA family protein
MSIVCGTDFSESALRATQAAAQLATRMNVLLHLVHSVELSADALFDEPRSTTIRWAKSHLQSVAERARTWGARVEIHVEEGPPDETLQDVAKRVSAQLIVVAALGQRREGKWQLGSHAERLAQRSHVPVLVVRSAELFEAWVHESRPLRILLGVDLSLTTESALRWIADLRKFGPCDVIASHLYWPPEQFHRLGLAGVRSYLEPDPEVTKTLARDIATRVQNVLGVAPVKMRLEPHLGRVGDRIGVLAEEERCELVVVGTHDRELAERILQGSVSRDVLHDARVSVVCVPASASELAATKPKLDSVLVATDFSPIGDAAIALAYSVVAPGGTVHVVHVAKEESRHSVTDPRDIFPSGAAEVSSGEAAVRQRLLELVPKDAADQIRTTQLHVLHSNDVAAAICQAAERLGAAMLCLGTHGRTGLSNALLGSVAQSVLATTGRPVLLTRAPRA